MAHVTRRSLVRLPLYFTAGSLTTLFGQSVLIKLGTGAPKGSSWHDALNQMKQDWARISNGAIRVNIYAGGVAGDDTELVRKIQRRGLDAIGISGLGLSRIEPGVNCLNIPMMVESYEEFDHIREKMTPLIEKRIESKGFRILNWTDIGWVHFFTKTPAKTLDDIRQLKLWISTGDPHTEKLYKQLGFRVVPLPVTDVLTSLQTGLIEAFQAPPLFAMLERSFEAVNNMIDMRWAPLVGATIISDRAWQRIPEDIRPQMLTAARKAGDQMRDEIRSLDRDAIVQMKQRGLNVIEPDAATMADWRRQAEDAYPTLRGTMVPEDLFDEVKRHRDAYRASKSS
ncbi:MAG: TRAP transporter substrate-binding protein DctP [Bryobacterales bacterium]|nr:TRAP transporter substrate-binding protein DctP [Bryobacterales bacterium]MDE0295526.1 TRAP transporter substrate-binding protein DctP [Bryobacterales bacterium]MDE0433685.1 TRAP transporter substrate-binding protein DctP [Bryobacterales bacterium]